MYVRRRIISDHGRMHGECRLDVYNFFITRLEVNACDALICERGLREARPEKKPNLNVSAAILVRSCSPLWMQLLRKMGKFRLFPQEKGRFSPQSRLGGGARSHLRTLLRSNSLLTGKNTGNFAFFGWGT